MPAPSEIDLNRALSAHQAGRLTEAEEIYRKFIEATPDNADICHLLGALLHQKGNIKQAEQFLNQALKLDPQFPEAYNSRGILRKEAGRLAQAEQDFRAALKEVPDFPQALTNLADTLRLSGDFETARGYCDQAIKLAPDLAPAHNNLGALERDLSNLEHACRAFQKALDLDANLVDARINLAATLNTLNQTDEALKQAQIVVQDAPDYAPAHNCLGLIYFDRGNMAAARESFQIATEINPTYGEAHNNLANSLTRLNKSEDALTHFEIALEIEPENADFRANQAAALQAENNIIGALQACEKALLIKPDHADAHWNRGLARLISGDLVAGFEDYEWRWQLPEFSRRHPDHPIWPTGKNTAELAGKTLLIHSEQGYGDTLQFIRYVRQLSDLGPKQLLLETHEPLRHLLASIPEIDQVFVPGEALPDFDYHLPIMSLPHFFQTTLDTIPGDVPYLTAPVQPDLNLADSPEAKIGLVWAGRPSHKNDRNRSLPFETLVGLLNMSETNFYSLQIGERATDMAGDPRIVDLSPKLVDFAATAAVINQLDLVITVDTAVAHLAGALAKTCYVLLPYAPDWRWLLDRKDSPWYPSLTLYRQSAPGDWKSVIDCVIEDRLSA
jgi:tetratricopeptide (TPR) repeat protein